MSLHPSESGLLWRSVSAELPVTAEMFVGGRLRVACAATVHHLYDQRDTLDFFTPDTDPRPERITLNGGASKTFQSWILLFLLFLLPMMAMGQNYDFESFDYNSVYDEENHHNIGLSLVGG
ncbi:unnamed protein product [Diatraea saccharalis]|uniref:Uncharacterized protein n=1 Tax=Diatraea saccharalis TaxID=40085 RepID=A0A9N9WC81_9NEOP|nr:unnamed protein product [Diatraea saccharalis]